MGKVDTPITRSQNARVEYSIKDVMNLLKSLEEKQDNGLKIINSKLSNNDDNFKILKKSLEDLTISFNSLKNENESLKNDVNVLRVRVQTLESGNLQKIDLVNEATDRLSRSRNLLFFNIPEDSQVNDTMAVNSIISAMDLKLSVANVNRIGNSSSKNRPLRVVFSDISDVSSLLKSKVKLRKADQYKHVWINSDLTFTQREHMKSLRQELSRKREIGESNWIIKYTSGIPSLCQKN